MGVGRGEICPSNANGILILPFGPPELLGRESGGELEKSSTISSSGLLNSLEKNPLLSSFTFPFSSGDILVVGGVHSPPTPRDVGIELGRDS